MQLHIAAEAKERMRAGGGDKKSGVAKLPHPIPDQGKARDQAAELAGVSGNNLHLQDTSRMRGNYA